MSLATLARTHPRLVDGGIHLDRAPAAGWLALQAAALLPTWLWMAGRTRDGSDDPLGLLALAALAWLACTLRHALRPAPRLGWLSVAALGTVLASVLRTGAGSIPPLPPLAIGLIAVLAFNCGLLAFLPARIAALPVAGLAILALPLLSSLQFYAGYPLRVLTAEATRWLLSAGFSATRTGSNLLVNGQLVIVDAPCSGIQMAWFGYFTASVVALWARRNDRSFAARLPIVGALVLAGNIVRNSVLVALEAVGHAPAPWLHGAFGLALLGAVCGGIAWTMAQDRQPATPKGQRHVDAAA